MFCWLSCEKNADLRFLRYFLALQWLNQNWTSLLNTDHEWCKAKTGFWKVRRRPHISRSETQYESSSVGPTRWPLPSQNHERHIQNISELRQEIRWLTVIVYKSLQLLWLSLCFMDMFMLHAIQNSVIYQQTPAPASGWHPVIGVCIANSSSTPLGGSPQQLQDRSCPFRGSQIAVDSCVHVFVQIYMYM